MPTDSLEKWAPWIGGFVLLFLSLTYAFLGPIQQTIFTGEINAEEKSIKVSVESENEKIIYSVIFGFFGSLIIITLIWAGVKIYQIKHG